MMQQEAILCSPEEFPECPMCPERLMRSQVCMFLENQIQMPTLLERPMEIPARDRGDLRSRVTSDTERRRRDR